MKLKTWSQRLGLSLLLCLAMNLSVPSAPAAESELLVGDFYRAPLGAATITLPPFDPATWQLKQSKSGETRTLSLYLGTPATYRGYVQVIFLPPMDKPVTAQQLAQSFAAQLLKDTGWLKAQSKGQALDAKSIAAQAFAVPLAGQNQQGVAEVVGIAAFVDGKSAVLTIQRANAQDMQGALRQVADPLLNSLHVGSKVPRLKPLNPGTPIEGAYVRIRSQGGLDWLVFDKRGYCHEYAPVSSLYLDAALMLQAGSNLLNYTNQKGKVTLLAHKNMASRTLVPDGKNFKLDGYTYYRTEKLAEGQKIEGSFESFSFISTTTYLTGDQTTSFSSSKEYHFTLQGAFSTRSLAAAQSVFRSGTDVYSNADSGMQEGRYSFSQGQLLLQFANGQKVALPVFVPAGDKGKTQPGILYIAGSSYLRDD
ncbi:MAG: hypothetical protein ACAI44_30095 [Candidatus Sericytochromatia bacterium]